MNGDVDLNGDLVDLMVALRRRIRFWIRRLVAAGSVLMFPPHEGPWWMLAHFLAQLLRHCPHFAGWVQVCRW